MADKKITDWIVAIASIGALTISIITLYLTYIHKQKGFTAQYLGLRFLNDQSNMCCEHIIFSNKSDFEYGIRSISFLLDYNGGYIQQPLSIIEAAEPFVVEKGRITIKKICFEMKYDKIPLEDNKQVTVKLLSRINFIKNDGGFDFRDFHVNDIRFKGHVLSGTFPGTNTEKIKLDDDN